MTRIRCVPGWFSRNARSTLSLVMIACWSLSGVSWAGGDAVSVSPTEFKAAFLSKIVPYVKWPGDALPKADGPLVVGLFGHDPFDGLLQKLLAGQTLYNRKVVVEVLTHTNRIGECQVLYVPSDKLAEWLKLKPEGAGHGILTVGADRTGRFLKSGGIFNLLVDEHKLEISRRNAEKAGLKINSQLLRIAKLE